MIFLKRYNVIEQGCLLKNLCKLNAFFGQNNSCNVYSRENDKMHRVVELELRGNDKAVLKSYATFACLAGQYFNIDSKTWSLRKPIHERYTVLKSAHIYKKHRVQYEFRTYYTFVQYKYLTGSTTDTLLEYIERNIPEGVSLKVTKIELEGVPNHLKQASCQ